MALRRDQILSHYRIIEQLGKGGMGAVYLAEDTVLRRRVALKVLPVAFSHDVSRLRRFKQEARAIAAVNHPNIITIHSIEECDGLHFFTMELVDGRTLTEIIDEAGLPLREVFDIARPLVGAVAVAHAHGVTHRDLKPSNVMVSGGGTLKVLDFGLAKLATAAAAEGEGSDTTTTLLASGVIAGTPGYMSPEQAAAREIDHRTDVFSLGVILFEMITGRRPFRGNSATEVLAALLMDEPPAVAELVPDCPGRLASLVDRCLQKDPDLRWASLEDMAAELAASERDLEKPVDAARESIAVLPFADMSPERDQGYFCEGIAEEIINALTKVEGLEVASRMSAFQYRAVGDSRVIGRNLGVRTLLEGSVRKSGDRIRVVTQLIDADRGYHLWSESYDRRFEDIFAIQDEIACSIVQRLQVTLGAEAERGLVGARTEDARAYDFYLRGRGFFRRWGKRYLEIAQRMFSRAIELDPGFASAHAGLADTYSYQYMYIVSSCEVCELAESHSRRALELDPDLAEGYASLGLALSLGRRHDEAEKQFERAVRLDPMLFEAHYFHARNSAVQGKYEEAIRHYEKAHEIMPEDYQIPLLTAQILSSLGRDEEAEHVNREGLALAERAIECNPEDARACYMGASAMVRLGEVERGRVWAARALALDPEDPAILYNVACVHAVSGALDEAIDCLERTVRAGASYKEWMLNDSDLDALRGHPRFEALLADLA